MFAIGDLQGCHDCLQQLLVRAGALPGAGHAPGSPRLWLTGDLVNRGPQSLQTLRWAYQHRSELVTVLGNHDLHLLAVAAGIRPMHRDDTLGPILAAPDREELLHWLRRQPLAHLQHGYLLVHAGVLPQWSAQQAVALAAEVGDALSGPHWVEFLRTMYGNHPVRWDDHLTGADRLRVIVNALTRLRFCTPQGDIDLMTKEGPDAAPPGHLPWFDVGGRRTADVTVVFGHWSTLGYLERNNLIGLDTGCVWGGQLTAVRLATRERFQADCPRAAAPG